MVSPVKKIAIVAGEASGDLLGAAIIQELLLIFPKAEIIGVAGSKMLEAGAKTLFPLEKLSVMGFSEVIVRLRELLQLRNYIKNYFLQNPPDIYIGVDAPDFNLPIEIVLKKSGIKTVHVNSPTIWAWRKKRIYKIARAVNLMLTLFPFEPPYYIEANIPVKYIGHPLADMIPLEPFPSPNKKIIALLPGSRGGEIKYIGPTLLKAAELIFQKYPDSQFIAPMINKMRLEQFEKQWKSISPKLPLTLILGKAHDVIKKSDIVAVASGTATLETMLLKRPMVVLYKGSFISYWIARFLIKIKQFSLPNILANDILVPEFIQENATPENIANSIEDYFLYPEKIEYLNKRFAEIHQVLKYNAAKKAAEAIKQLINEKTLKEK